MAGFMALSWGFSLGGTVLCLFGLYRAGNMIRILEGRMHEHYLRRAVRRSMWWLAGMQTVVLSMWLAYQHLSVHTHILWSILATAQLLVAAVLCATTVRHMRRTAWPQTPTHYSDAELPTVTVAIPARNETDDLQACLASIVASNYPKLEIIVLDDCSQMRRTPEIIRGFAHDGVRFVKGEEPDLTWLPKNQAYDHLADEANGDFILFCGVDIRFDPGALRNIVGVMLARKKHMMSILPERDPSVRAQHALTQAMRYMWELVPPRRLFKRPPVLSSCWIIQKSSLKAAGRFAAVRRSIVPEAHFARFTAAADTYSFMRAGRNPGVRSIKAAREQYGTAVRMRYPQLHRRPESVLLLATAEFVCVLLPFVLAIGGYWLGVGVLATVLASITMLLLVATYLLVAYGTKLDGGPLAVCMLPVVIINDLLILHRSMWQYEFSEVAWKGRNVCVPAMHVIPHLPKL
jgi:hypothetical protein